MGGGSGSGRSSLGNIKSLEKKARKVLDKGVRRNTFLSFDYDDIDEVNLLRAQAKNEKSEIEFIDRSVRDPINSERADYIKQKIVERIRQCSQTVVYITEATHSSDWVKLQALLDFPFQPFFLSFFKAVSSELLLRCVFSVKSLQATAAASFRCLTK